MHHKKIRIMKKNITVMMAIAVLGLTGIANNAIAQDGAENKREVSFKLRFGVKGGLNIANVTIDNNGSVNDKKAIPSFNLGMYADIALLPMLSLQPGLTVGGKGAKFNIGDPESNNYSSMQTRPIYLELPVNMVVKIPLVNKVKLFAGAGPYIAAGIGGKNKIEGKVLGLAYSDDSKITYSNDGLDGNNGNFYKGDLKRFDAGFNVLAGLEISHFTLNANYGYGLMNIKPGSTNGVDNKYQNRVVSIQVGLLF